MSHSSIREQMRREETESGVTEMCKRLDSLGESPVGKRHFDIAWDLLRRDRPEVPAHKCRLRRLLVKRWYPVLQELLRDDDE